MELERAAVDVRGEVLEVAALLAREPDPAQVLERRVEHLAWAGKAPAGKERDEAIVDGTGGGPGELLKNDRAAQRRKALAAQCDLDRPDRVDYPRQHRIGAAQMRHRFAHVRYTLVRHRARIIADSAAGASLTHSPRGGRALSLP
jgi:hypothetical protein